MKSALNFPRAIRFARSNLAVAMLALVSVACGDGSNRVSSLRDFREVIKLDLLERAGYPISNYQIGPEWGRFEITDEVMAKETPEFNKLVNATASVGGATGFYLGVHNGIHVMATNNHVIKDESGCYMATVGFQDRSGQIFEGFCHHVIGTWKDVDFTLFEARFTPQNAAKMSGRESLMRFDAPIQKGRDLMMAGFGIAGANTRRLYRGTHDSDCKVYSKDNEFRYMPDPDQVNPGEGKVWLFALGCDISHGDSGSAIAARDNGDLIGIISTGRIPKNPKVRESAYLDQIYADGSEDVWGELGYAVPAAKIAEYMRRQVSDPVIESVLRAGNGL